MREYEMRMRVERLLQMCGRRALVPALGIGLTIGGCATGRSGVRPGQPVAHPDTETGNRIVAIYSAQVRADEDEPDPPEPDPEEDEELDPALDLL